MIRDFRASRFAEFVLNRKIFIWLALVWLLIFPLIWLTQYHKYYNFSTEQLQDWLGISNDADYKRDVVEFDRIYKNASNNFDTWSASLPRLKTVAIISGKLLLASAYFQFILIAWALVRNYPDPSGAIIFPWKFVCRWRCFKSKIRRKPSHKNGDLAV